MSVLGALSRLLATAGGVRQCARLWTCQPVTQATSGTPGVRAFHPLTQVIDTGVSSSSISRLLPAATAQVVPSCGLKVKRRLKRRCKHCYIVARHQRWYVMCPVNPRHKQMTPLPRPESQWILSDVMQTPRRPW